MSDKLILVPGTSINTGSANITYPQGQILNVKDFYEQDSHVMPENLKEVRAAITEGIENIWFVYTPAELKENRPLIISFHGGGQSGWGQCYATSWAMLADKYGFVTIFPTASNGRGWNRDPDGPDFALTAEIIRRAEEEYRIDPTRIFIQGMSSGNDMVTALTKHWGYKFAGAGMAAGPSSVELYRDPDYDLSVHTPVPICQSRGERDTLCPQPDMTRPQLNIIDREFWAAVNGCKALPKTGIRGLNNYLYYDDGKAPLLYRDVKYRGHGQTVDDAEILWRTCFSGCKRDPDGSLTFADPIEPFQADEAVILADGVGGVIINGERSVLSASCYELLQVMEVSEGMLERMPELKNNIPTYGPFLYAPAELLEKAFGYTAEYSYDGRRAVFTAEGMPTLQFAEGNVGCTVDGVLKNLERQPEYKKGILYLPMKGIAEMLGKVVIYNKGSMYITDHAGEMTDEMADVFKTMLQ